MGFDITKFQKKYKHTMDENAQLQERLAEFEKQKAIDVQNAVLAAVTPLRQEIQQLKADVAHEQRKTSVEEVSKQLLADRISELEAMLAKERATIAEERAARADLQAKYDEQKPAVVLAEEKVKMLTVELKKHSDKMSRRERERVAAIENRKILSAVVPARNPR